jgi:hypothetical protein
MQIPRLSASALTIRNSSCASMLPFFDAARSRTRACSLSPSLIASQARQWNFLDFLTIERLTSD